MGIVSTRPLFTCGSAMNALALALPSTFRQEAGR